MKALLFIFLFLSNITDILALPSSSPPDTTTLPLYCHGLDSIIKIPPSVLTDNEIFFLGEVHNNANNPCLKINFLKYLHKQANVRNIVQEFGPGTAFFVNQYLKSGSDSLLAKIASPFALEEEYLLELYKFNQAQKAEKKLHIIGIDLDYFCHNIKALISIFSQSRKHNEFASILKKLQEIPHKKIVGAHTGYIRYVYPMESWEKIRKEIIVAYQDAPDFFKNKLGDNIYYLERILGTYSDTGPSSESFKYNNFIAAHQQFGQLGKYFINYGANHVRVQLLIEGIIQGQMLAAQLMHEKKSPFRNKVISVGIAYSTLKKQHNRAVFKHMEKEAKQYYTFYNMRNIYKHYPGARKHYHFILFTQLSKK